MYRIFSRHHTKNGILIDNLPTKCTAHLNDIFRTALVFKGGNTKMKMIYNVKDKPKFGQLIIFAFQQLLAIMAATIAVPMIVGNGMSTSAALFGAGAGTLIYVLFTKAKSPVFLGSSFAFLGSMATAFAGAVTSLNSTSITGLVLSIFEM